MSTIVNIRKEDLKRVKKIGQGGYGAVYHMIWQKESGNVDVAAKVLLEIDHNEVKVLSALSHPNIVKLIAIVSEEFFQMFILELCEGGSLRSYIEKQKGVPLPPPLFRDWSQQGARAIEYLQEMEIIHKDIKSENYLITKDKILKLSDFGLAKTSAISFSQATDRGTAPYMAPELFTKGILSPSFDIFAYGVVLWEMATGQIAYEGMERNWIVYNVCEKKMRLPIPEDCPAHLADLMRRCWLEDRHERPKIAEILTVLTEETLPSTEFISHQTLYQAVGGFQPATTPHTRRGKPIAFGHQLKQKDVLEDSGIDSWQYERRFGYDEGPGQLQLSQGIAQCPNGNVAIATWGPVRCVKVYDGAGGEYRFPLDTSQGLEPGQVTSPWAIAVSPDGTFFVTDLTQCVKVFESNGTYRKKFATKCPEGISADVQQIELLGITMDSKGHVLTGECKYEYISKHRMDGTHLENIKIGLKPRDIAATPHDTIVVSCRRPNRPILVIDQTGQQLYTLDNPAGVTMVTNWWPQGVCCHGKKIFLSLQADKHCYVVSFSLSSKYLGNVYLEGISNPRGIVLTKKGANLMVVEYAGGVKVFSRK